MKIKKNIKKYFEHLKKVKLVIVLPLVFIFVFVFGSVLRNIIVATGTPWVQTDWSGGVGASTTNQFSSSTNINYSTGGEVKLSKTAGSWLSDSWGMRKKIVFNNTTGNLGVTSEALTNYAILVKLSVSNFDFSKAKTNGEDIRFTDSDGTTALAYEFEKYDSTSQVALIWVKVPQIDINSSTDNIYMYYGNSGASDAQSPSSVWDSNYKIVYHMNQTSGFTITDSTGQNNGTAINSPTPTTSGKIGSAYDFPGPANPPAASAPAVTVASNAGLNTGSNFTMSAWVKADASNGYRFIMGKSNYWSNNDAGIHNYISKVELFAGSGCAGTSYVNISNGTWYHLEGTYDGVNRKLYVNGVLAANASCSGQAINNAYNFTVGGETVPAYGWDGIIDEVRYSNTPRTAGWVAADYKNDTDSYSTYNSEENLYNTTSTLTSNIYDTLNGSDWDLLTYTATTPAGTGVSVKVRAGNQSNLSDATAFSSCSATSNNSDLSGGCSVDNKRYVQYELTLTGNGSVTPTFNDISIDYSPSDLVPPSANASSVTMYRTNGGTTVNSGAWTSVLSPKFTWATGTDETGIKGYCLRLVNKSSLAPTFDDTSPTDLTNITYNSSGLIDSANTPVNTVGTNCNFIITGTEIDFANQAYRLSPWLTTSSELYYLFIKVIDVGNNMYVGPSAFFKFKFDSTVPTNVSYISSASGTFGNVNDMNFSWPVSGGTASSDNDSGLLGWQYQINSSSGTWQGTNVDSALGVNYIPSNYSSFPYFLTSGVDGPNIQIGNNVIYFRTIDVAGNVSSPASLRTANISFGGDAPTFPSTCDNTTGVTVTPTTSISNLFGISWPAATPAPGRSISKYYYMINTEPPATLGTINSNSATYKESNTTSVSSSTLSGVVKGANTIYVVAVDDIDIYSSTNCLKGVFTLNSNLPDPPSSLSVSDASIKSASLWRASLAWGEPSYKGTGILSYKIYRSEDGSTWTNIGTTSGNAYLDTVTESKRYYWRVSTIDNTVESQNSPSYSNAVSLIPKGVFTVAPSLTSTPQALDISTKRAKISWTTSREADSKIAYGIKSGEYFSEEVYNSVGNTEHLISLSNLSPETLYYYVAKWTDEDGNTGTSTELSFRTLEAPRVREVSVTNISISSALIKYTARGASSVKIYYGKSTDFGAVKEIPTSPIEAPYTSQLTGLDDGTKYIYKINSLDADGNEYQGTVLDFTTLPRPRLFEINFSQIRGTAQPSVLVSWNSNTEVSTVVSYYEASNPGIVKDETNPNLIKGVNRAILRSLNPETNYAMVIKARDKIGNEVISDIYQFTTAIDTRPPTISGLKVESVVPAKSGQSTGAQIIVSWNTDKPATSQVEFGEGTGGNYSQKTQEETNLKQNHLVVISDLTPSKVYSIRALSRDKAGNIGKSSGNNTLTPKSVDSALDIVITILSDAFSFLSGINK